MKGPILLCGLLTLQVISGFPSHRQRKDTAVTYSKCENTYDQCADWKKSGLCDLPNYKDYMTMQCPVACGLCLQDAEGKIDTSKAPVYQAYNPASYAQPATNTEPGYQSSQQTNNNQYNPVADSAPYVPPVSLTPDSSQGADKPSETSVSNSQFASNLLKPEEGKDAMPELKQVSNDKIEDGTNEGTNEKDVSASKHIEKEKLKDLTGDSVINPKPAKAERKKGLKKIKAKAAIRAKHESSGFHSGLGEEGSGGSMQGFSAESSGSKELASGSGGVELESLEDLVDLVDDGFDDDLTNDDDDDDDLLKTQDVFSTRLSPAGGETFNTRSDIEVPKSDQDEESGSASAAAEDDNESSSHTHGESELASEKESTKKIKTHASNAVGEGDQEENKEKSKEKEEGKAGAEPQKESTGVPHKAPEEDEKAEKYQDSENDKSTATETQKDYKKTKPSKSNAKHQTLLGNMLDSGKLKAYAVHKGTQASKVRADVVESDNDQATIGPGDITSAANELFSASGLSGSGAGQNTFQVILRQTYDSKYGDESTPAFQILAGNFENDVEEAIGGDSDVSNISFSEAEIEGNPRVVGKVKVTFKLNGDYNKLQEIVNTGNINGMLVMKNSLEGTILEQQ